MVKQHLKRINAPRTWDIDRKTNKFSVRPNPGGRKMDFSIPLLVLFRDMLDLVKNTREMDYVLKTQKIIVDGKARYSPEYPVGFMDVVEASRQAYRLLINQKNKLFAKKIPSKEATLKLVKINNKCLLAKAAVQLNLSDGRNMIVKKDSYKTGDSLLLEIPSQTIKEHLPLSKGALVLLIKGSHVGQLATVDEIKDSRIFITIDSTRLETKKEYALVVGKTKPVIEVQ